MAESVGFLELGRTYAKCADFLSDAVCSEAFKIDRDQPIDFLYAHALELMLKGCMLEHDPTQDLEFFGHDLLRLYDDIKSAQLLGNLMVSVENALRERWKLHLRNARDRYSAALGFGETSAETSEEFGIFDNDVIGRELPELRKQIIWLSQRHKDGGSQFRYLKCGLDYRGSVKAFGLSDDIVWITSRWACEEIYNRFRKNWSRRQKSMPNNGP